MEFVDLGAQRRRLAGRVEQAITRVLHHGRYIMGPEIALLEERLADRCGVRNAVTCSSGTDALLIPLLAWGVGPGDAVLVPTFTFAATAEVVALAGATPVLVDVDETSFNLDPVSLRTALDSLSRSDLRPVGIIAVDMFGQPADYEAITGIASDAGLWLMADAAQSFGASSGGCRTGSLGDVAATSFFPAKPLGCYGDGGAMFTDDDQFAGILRSLRSHGQGTNKYDHIRVGANGRLDTIQAAVLLEKLAIFDEEFASRQDIAARYSAALGGNVSVPVPRCEATSAWAPYTITLQGRDDVARSLMNEGIPTAIYYPKPLHEQEAYRGFPRAPGGMAVSTRLSRTVLSLPMHPYLQRHDQDRVIDAVLRAATVQATDGRTA